MANCLVEFNINLCKIIIIDKIFTQRPTKMKYRVHRLKIRMTEDQRKLEEFLNSLEGEIISIIPNVCHIGFVHVDFILIVEKIA